MSEYYDLDPRESRPDLDPYPLEPPDPPDEEWRDEDWEDE